ncbi:MAG TPA: hypothetical protein VK465_00190, partial [Fibrobacteria bacterium]|nr:hypothetical protein [Fibrobacteria bacterium]
MKAFLEMPYRQFQFYLYLLQRANWGKIPAKHGWFIFRYKSLEFQTDRYTQTCVKRLQSDGYIAQFSRVSGVGEGYLSKEFLGPRKGSIPLRNAFLLEAISSEHAFIFSKLLVLKRLHPTWTKAKMRTHLTTQYRGINPLFLRDFDAFEGHFSEPMPKRPGQFLPIPAARLPAEQASKRVGESLAPKTISVPEFPTQGTAVPQNRTAVPPNKGVPNIGIRTKDIYENLSIKVSDQQKRQTYRIPKEVAGRLRSFLISFDAKYKLDLAESNFILSVTHSLSLKDLPEENLESLLKSVYAAFWFCTQRNRNIRTKSCLWNRVYAYALHNHGDWLWREFQS